MMECRGSYRPFDLSTVKTYPLRRRASKVEVSSFVDCAVLAREGIRPASGPWFRDGAAGAGPGAAAGLTELARQIVRCRKDDKPVVMFTGAHPIKNGLSPIIVDLIQRGIVTLYATNCATAIHSFELALTGASSESVTEALPAGEFGMAFETGAYLNGTLALAAEGGLGFGEALGRLFLDPAFRRAVIDRSLAGLPQTGEYLKPYDGFPYVDSCIFAAAFEKGTPACVHVGVGTDIIDQHPTFDAAAKGAASGIDFLIFAEHCRRFTAGGVFLNVGSAVTGPEVLLKAVSMAANVGSPPRGLWTANFDLRPFGIDRATSDEAAFPYYFRDQKSVTTRIPQSFAGSGLYFQGPHHQTLIPLYQHIRRELDEDKARTAPPARRV